MPHTADTGLHVACCRCKMTLVSLQISVVAVTRRNPYVQRIIRAFDRLVERTGRDSARSIGHAHGISIANLGHQTSQVRGIGERFDDLCKWNPTPAKACSHRPDRITIRGQQTCFLDRVLVERDGIATVVNGAHCWRIHALDQVDHLFCRQVFVILDRQRDTRRFIGCGNLTQVPWRPSRGPSRCRAH